MSKNQSKSDKRPRQAEETDVWSWDLNFSHRCLNMAIYNNLSDTIKIINLLSN